MSNNALYYNQNINTHRTLFPIFELVCYRPTPLVAPPRPMLRSLPRRSPLQGSFDKGDCGSEQLTVPAERNIRSAPTRRRLKVGSAANGAARKKGGGRRGEESSGDEEIEEQPSAPPRVGSAGARGRRGLRVGAEIVTMVSLVSPAGSSDSEDDRSPRLSTSPIPVLPTQAWQPAEDKPFVPATPTSAQVIVCARKITKSGEDILLFTLSYLFSNKFYNQNRDAHHMKEKN